MCVFFKFLISGYNRTNVIISDSKIEFYLNKILYLKILWKDIEQIDIIEETWSKPDAFVGLLSETGYRVLFKGRDLKKSIRLWCCSYRKSRQLLIISYIRDIIEKHNIQLNTKKEEEKLNWNQTKSAMKKYNQFRDYYRNKKAKK